MSLYLPPELWDYVIESDTRTAAVCFSINSTFHVVSLKTLQWTPPAALCTSNRVPSFDTIERALVVKFETAVELRKLYVVKKSTYPPHSSRKQLPMRHRECLAQLLFACDGATGLMERMRKKRRSDALVAQCRSKWQDVLTFKELQELCDEAVAGDGGMDALTAKVDARLEEKRLKEIADKERADAERVACEQRRLEWEAREAARTEAARPFFDTLCQLAAARYPRSLCAREMETICWKLAYEGISDENSLFRAIQLQRCRTHDLRCKRTVDGVRCKGRCRSTANLVCEGCSNGMPVFV
jgi:hypothetical protein